MELYYVYAVDKYGDVIANKRVTNNEMLDTCIKYAKHDWGVNEVCVNRCYFCFDGYLEQGEFLGKF